MRKSTRRLAISFFATQELKGLPLPAAVVFAESTQNVADAVKLVGPCSVPVIL